MITRISHEKWMHEWKNPDITSGIPRSICVLPFTVSEIESHYNLSFEAFDGDGLGDCFMDFIEIDGLLFWLQGAISRDSIEMGITVFIKQTKKNPLDYLNAIYKGFDLTEMDMKEINREWIIEFSHQIG